MAIFVPNLLIMIFEGYDIRKKARNESEVPSETSVFDSSKFSWKKVASTLNKFQIKPHIKNSRYTKKIGKADLVPFWFIVFVFVQSKYST